MKRQTRHEPGVQIHGSPKLAIAIQRSPNCRTINSTVICLIIGGAIENNKYFFLIVGVASHMNINSTTKKYHWVA